MLLTTLTAVAALAALTTPATASAKSITCPAVTVDKRFIYSKTGKITSRHARNRRPANCTTARSIVRRLLDQRLSSPAGSCTQNLIHGRACTVKAPTGAPWRCYRNGDTQRNGTTWHYCQNRYATYTIAFTIFDSPR